MKYALINSDNITEIKNDSYKLPEGAIELTDEQYDQLLSGLYILQNGSIVANPIPPKALPL